MPRLYCWLLCLAVPLAAARAPIRHEDVWLMKRVGAPAPSPDGKWVVFSVTEPAYDEKDQVSDLWMAPADGSAQPRRLTATKGGESGVAWSPDSRRIAFSAKREGDEAAQIYLLELAGGEAARLTAVSTGARAPRFSPDGRTLLFQTSVDRAAAERQARKYRARVYESFPIRFWDHWLDPETQTRLLVQSPEPGAKARDLLAGTKLAADPGFAAPFTLGPDEDLEAAWAPDGESIIVVASTNRNAGAHAFPAYHLYQVQVSGGKVAGGEVSGGEPKALTAGNDSYSKPAFRPDGKALYAVHTRLGEKAYNQARLAMWSWPHPTERTLVSAGLDRAVSSFAFAPDNRTVYLTAEEAGHEKLFSVPAGGGEARLALKMSAGVYTNLTMPEKAPGLVLLANWESAVNPGEVVRLDLAAQRRLPLTGFNEERAAAIDWQPLRHFWFTSKGGKRIHSMLALPPGFDERQKYPLLVIIHGGPNNMWRDYFFVRWNYHLLAAPGYVVLLTNYTGSTGFGEQFAQQIEGDPYATPGNEINEAADQAIRQFPFIDGTRQAAGGASYGGSLANWLLATTTRYKCLINHAGMFNLESMSVTTDMGLWLEKRLEGPAWEQRGVWRDQNPFRLAKNFRTPMLVTHGENDYRVPLSQALEVWNLLQRQKVPSRLVVFPEENHWVMKGEDSRYFYQEVQEWLKKHLSP